MPETYFPNLAGDPTCDETIREELGRAGIPEVRYPESMRGYKSEVPYGFIGQQGMWSFRRAWRYWVAEGPGIPPDDAKRLHERFGQSVRVDGHCCCPSPREWFGGFGVGLYHVDTQEGLNALAETIATVMVRNGADLVTEA